VKKVMPEQMVLPEQKAIKATLGTQVLQVLMAHKGNKVFKAFKVNVEMQAQLAHKVKQVQKAMQAQLDHKVNKALRDKLSRLITKAFKVFKAKGVLRAMLEKKATLEKQDQWDLPEQMAHKAFKDHKANTVLTELPDLWDQLALLDQKAIVAIQVLPDHKEFKVSKDLRAMQDYPVHKDQLDHKEFKVSKDQQVQQVPLVLEHKLS
jgi:hypothetical protein